MDDSWGYPHGLDTSIWQVYFSAGCSCFTIFFDWFQAFKMFPGFFHSLFSPAECRVAIHFCLYAWIALDFIFGVWICSWTCWCKDIHGDLAAWKLRAEDGSKLSPASPRRPQAAGGSSVCQARPSELGLGTCEFLTWYHGNMLVGGLEHQFYFPIYWVANHPNWLIYFSEGFKPPTSMINVWLGLGTMKIWGDDDSNDDPTLKLPESLRRFWKNAVICSAELHQASTSAGKAGAKLIQKAACRRSFEIAR